MPTLDEKVRAFLALERIAVAGVSRAGGSPANLIAKKLRSSGRAVFAVNPRAGEIDGEPCYPDLRSIAGGVDGVVIVTPPEAALDVVRDAAAAGVRSVWMHRAFGKGSVSADAVRLGREQGIEVIDGACPMMYLPPVDIGHRCFRWFMKFTGGLPRGE